MKPSLHSFSHLIYETFKNDNQIYTNNLSYAKQQFILMLIKQLRKHS